jgi:hypothetical protein
MTEDGVSPDGEGTQGTEGADSHAGRGPDPSAIGLGLAFVGMVLLTLTPVLGRWAEIPQGLAVTALGSSLLLIFLGAALGILAGREK